MGALTLAGERRAPPPTVAAPQAQLPLGQEREGHVAWRTPHPPLPGAPNVVVLQTTAGWRKAPA